MHHRLTSVVLSLLLLSASASVPHISRSGSSKRPNLAAISACSEWKTLFEPHWMQLPECHTGASTAPCCELYDFMAKSVGIFNDKLGCKFANIHHYSNKFSVHCSSSGRIPGPTDTEPGLPPSPPRPLQQLDDSTSPTTGHTSSGGGCINCGGGCVGPHCGCTGGNCRPPPVNPCSGPHCGCTSPYCKPPTKPPCTGGHCGCSGGHCGGCSGGQCGCVGNNCGNPVGACVGQNCGCTQCVVSAPAPAPGTGTGTGGTPNQGQVVIPPDDNDDICFHGNGAVKLQDGTVKLMKELSVGDVVHVGGGKFSEVFMFTHQDANKRSTYVNMTVGSGEWVMVTPTHYMYSSKGIQLAGELKEGDLVEMDDGRMEEIVVRELVRDKGLYNPQTSQGSIIVNGIKATTYTKTVDPRLAHAVLAPVRALFKVCEVDLLTRFIPDIRVMWSRVKSGNAML